MSVHDNESIDMIDIRSRPGTVPALASMCGIFTKGVVSVKAFS